MSPNDASPPAGFNRDQMREAALWMTLLRRPDRAQKVERGFRRWLDANPAHGAAFGTLSDAWEITGALPRGPFPRLSHWQRTGFREGFVRAAAAMLCVTILAGLGAFLYLRDAGFTTGVGEQRLLALEDGSRVYLNTDTRVVVRFDAARRWVELEGGEALFEVAQKDVARPFIVTAGDRQVQALGTSFVVRRDQKSVSVTLMEGRVIITPSPGGVLRASEARQLPQARLMNPGQRLTFAARALPRVDHPPVEQVTAWRGGHVIFDETALGAAVEEMNRYSKSHLVVENTAARQIPVTGVFRTGDMTSFVNAVSHTYGLEVIEEADTLILTGAPRGNRQPHAHSN